MVCDWKEYQLGELVKLLSGGTPSKARPDFWNGTIPWLSAKDMKSFWIDDTEDHLTEIGAVNATRIVPAGTTLLLVRGMTLHNYVPICRTRKPCAFNQDVKALIALDGLDAEFLPYLLVANKDRLLGLVDSAGHGTGRLNTETLLSLPVRIPPLEEQKQLAQFARAIDDKIEVNRETSATLEALAQALFKSWFVDFDPVKAKAEGRTPEGVDQDTAALFPGEFQDSLLGPIPKGWVVKKIGEFINRLSVGTKYEQKTAKREGEIPILDQGKSGIIGYHDNLPGVIASTEDPVIVFANHTCYMRLITFPFSVIQNVLPFVGKEVDTVWAYFATKDKQGFVEYKGHWPDFVIKQSIVPNKSLTSRYRLLISPMLQRIRSNQIESEWLSTLRDTLLPKLFSGQLRIPLIEGEEGGVD